jgi:hypothetical protein
MTRRSLVVYELSNADYTLLSKIGQFRRDIKIQSTGINKSSMIKRVTFTPEYRYVPRYEVTRHTVSAQCLLSQTTINTILE